MDSIGIDLHKRESQLCILTEDGELIERRIAASRTRFTAVLGDRAPARVLLEASMESEWVARHLESLGHAVVADPGFTAMYATHSKRVKTDKRDARTLCEALQLGAYRAIHRASDAQRHLRAQLVVRDALVRTRTRYVAILKAFVRREGLLIPSGDAEHTVAKLLALPLPPHVREELAPVIALWAPLNAEITAADARLALAAEHPAVRRLRTMPGIGPVTAIARRGARRCDALSQRPPGASVPRPRAQRVQLRRSSAARAHHQTRRHAHAVALRRDRVADSALPECRPRRAQGVGASDRRATRQAHRDRGPRAPRGWHPVRDVARRRAVSGDPRPCRRCLATTLPPHHGPSIIGMTDLGRGKRDAADGRS